MADPSQYSCCSGDEALAPEPHQQLWDSWHATVAQGGKPLQFLFEAPRADAGVGGFGFGVFIKLTNFGKLSAGIGAVSPPTDEVQEESVRWTGWALAEGFVDYMKPYEFEINVESPDRPAGVPDHACLAIRRDRDCFTMRGTWNEGPRWSQVFRRLSFAGSGELISDDKITDSKEWSSRRFTRASILWHTS